MNNQNGHNGHLATNDVTAHHRSDLMSGDEFQQFASAAARYIADYRENIREWNVLPSVEPGYLRSLLPTTVPENPETWEDILGDFDRVIMPGLTHWASPRFHAYYPSGTSYASVVGEMLIAGLHCQGFSWIVSPVCTELEAMMMDWMAQLLGLPEYFLNSSDGPGGGVLQPSASDATYIGLLVAKETIVRRLKEKNPELDENILKTRLVAYSSDQSNSSVEKAGLLASVPMKLLPTDEMGRLHGDVLEKAMRQDQERGLIPCYVVGTLGSTPTCAFDFLPEIGEVCKQYSVWLHVDAAYAGSAFVCPEYRHLMKGVELCDSFNFNPHKWLLVNFDCSAMWIRDSRHLVEAFNVDRVYLAHNKQSIVPDYRHWQISLGRRNRALKLWVVLRSYGVQGLQAHIRRHVQMARRFEEYVRADSRFQFVSSALGLVCFRLQGDNSRSQALLDAVTARRKIYIIAGKLRDQLVLRFVVVSSLTEEKDIDFAWEEIRSQVDVLPPPAKTMKSAHKEPVNGTANGHTNGTIKTNGTKAICNEKCSRFATTFNGIEETVGTNGSC